MKRLIALLGFCVVGLFPIQGWDRLNAREEGPLSQEVTQLAGTMNWQEASFPVENFQGYTSPFGYRRSIESSNSEFHVGLDMSAPRGSYVRNWLDGTVIRVSSDPVCGTSVKVASGPWIHTYCHLEGRIEQRNRQRYLMDRAGGLQVREGQTVQAGDRIGRVGMSGRTTGPHLHWGLQYQEQWVNPSLVLQAMYDQQQQARLTQRPRGH